MANVIVLGSSNTDMTVRVPKLPEHGQTVLGGTFESGPGGKGANQAVAAQRAGGKVSFISAVGHDSLGREALEHYRREGVDTSHINVSERFASGVALIFVENGGENMIAVAPGANSQLTPEDVDRLPSAVFNAGGIFLASLEVSIPSVLQGLRRAKAAGMTTILNPAPASQEAANLIAAELDLVDILTPNQTELRVLAGIQEDVPGDILSAVSSLRGKSTRPRLVITLGSRGCLVVDQETTYVPARRVEATDAVGAGDAFNGALAVALAEGRQLVSAAEWACDAATLSVSRPGAQTGLPYRDEIDLLASSAREASQRMEPGASISSLGL